MKQIKLEVGKTYRNRKGEEVKIVSKDNTDRYPYQGSDDEWYTESGRFDICCEDPLYDLIEEVKEIPEPRYTFITPDDMKEVTFIRHPFITPGGVTKLTVEQVSNRIVVEIVPEAKGPKPGDAAERYRIMDYLRGYANNVTWNYEQLCWLIEGYLKQKEDKK